jgi:hypothetical protein
MIIIIYMDWTVVRYRLDGIKVHLYCGPILLSFIGWVGQELWVLEIHTVDLLKVLDLYSGWKSSIWTVSELIFQRLPQRITNDILFRSCFGMGVCWSTPFSVVMHFSYESMANDQQVSEMQALVRPIVQVVWKFFFVDFYDVEPTTQNLEP